MAVVKINAIEVPEGAGPELEKRFANRLTPSTGSPGFLSSSCCARSRAKTATSW